MSDPFSIIAGVCGLAVQIVDTGVKIKSLYEQFDGAPSSLADTVDLIRLHAADLNPAVPVGRDAEIPPHAAAVLAVSRGYCRRVLGELQGVAAELQAQLEKARGRGGARRRLATLKIVLKKDVLDQHEARLSQASGLLMQAKLSYIITLVQQLRVEIRASATMPPKPQLVAEQLQIAEATGSGGEQRKTAPSNTDAARAPLVNPKPRSGRLWPYFPPGPFRQFGLPQVTGCVEIRLPARRCCQCPRCPDAAGNKENPEDDAFSLRLRFPTWICNLVIESTVIHSTRGWLHHLRTHRVHALDSHASRAAIAAIQTGDISKLRWLFQTRVLGPRDILATHWEHSLIEFAIDNQQWDVAKFLSDINEGDVGPLVILRDPLVINNFTIFKSALLRLWKRLVHAFRPCLSLGLTSLFTYENGKSLPSPRYNPVIQVVSFSATSHCYVQSAMGYSDGDEKLPAIQAILESTWDENDFMESAELFKLELLELNNLVSNFFGMRPSLWLIDTLRKLLQRVLDTTQPPRPDGQLIYLHAISSMNHEFVHLRIHCPEVFPAYCTLFRDLLSKELREHYGVTSQEILHDLPRLMDRFWSCRWLDCFFLLGCVDRICHNWLEMVLGAIAVSEQEGKQVAEEWMESCRDYKSKVSGPWETRYPRLISVRGGSRPEDWKFWWSQPTDDLVGEFWSLVEGEQEEGDFLEGNFLEESLYAVPGAWVD